MMKSYQQLTQEQRYQIKACLKTGYSYGKIADEVGVHKSTISREIRRNRGLRGYRPKQAQYKAEQRKREKVKFRIKPETWGKVREHLEAKMSPEQIQGWLQINDEEKVSPEWIYQYILKDKQQGGSLYKHLRQKKKRRKRYGSKDRRGQIPNRVSIEKRPPEVETRERIGDWEADTIVGKGHRMALVTLVDRKTRFTLIQKVERYTAPLVKQAMIDLLAAVGKDKVRTITCDNGKEFSKHEEVAKALDTKVYFAHPYASWERGTNENTNGLIRQFFPKGSSFGSITDEDVEFVMNNLNHRPRKCLGFRTPAMLFLNNHRCT